MSEKIGKKFSAAGALLWISIVLLFVSLFYAIYKHIDGSGVFAIVAAVVFLIHLIVHSSDSEHSNHIKAAFARITGPFISKDIARIVVESLVRKIMGMFQRNKDHVTEENLRKLQGELDQVLDKFETDINKHPSDNSEIDASKNDHKPHHRS